MMCEKSDISYKSLYIYGFWKTVKTRIYLSKRKIYQLLGQFASAWVLDKNIDTCFAIFE